jgi:hypothetical protein
MHECSHLATHLKGSVLWLPKESSLQDFSAVSNNFTFYSQSHTKQKNDIRGAGGAGTPRTHQLFCRASKAVLKYFSNNSLLHCLG